MAEKSPVGVPPVSRRPSCRCGVAELRAWSGGDGCQRGSFEETAAGGPDARLWGCADFLYCAEPLILRDGPGQTREGGSTEAGTRTSARERCDPHDRWSLGVAMRFTLLDRVTAIEPGKSITAIKTLSLSEEYLADHFPCFPVMPGVLMLESMTQAAAWAIRLGEDFAHSIVVLREARNVKYGDFVEPGKVLTVTAEIQSQDGQFTKVKASGTVGERTSLTARLVLERYNMADRMAYGDAVDARVRAEMRKLWGLLCPVGRQQGGRRVAYGGPGTVLPATGTRSAGLGDSGLLPSPAVVRS